MKSAALLPGWLVLLLFPWPAAGRVIPMNTCVANLVQIDGAVQQWALERKLTATNSYSFENPELLSYLKGSALPQCPGGGRYFPSSTVAGPSRCSVHGTANRPIDAERTKAEFSWRGEAVRALLISSFALLAVFAVGQGYPAPHAAAVRLVAGLVLALAGAWCFRKSQDETHEGLLPFVTLFIYSASGAVAFAALRRDPRKAVRLLAFAGSLVMGVISLLIVIASAITAKSH